MNNELKTFNIRLPKEIWAVLKKQSILQEKSMNQIIVSCVEKKYKKDKEKMLDSE